LAAIPLLFGHTKKEEEKKKKKREKMQTLIALEATVGYPNFPMRPNLPLGMGIALLLRPLRLPKFPTGDRIQVTARDNRLYL